MEMDVTVTSQDSSVKQGKSKVLWTFGVFGT